MILSLCKWEAYSSPSYLCGPGSFAPAQTGASCVRGPCVCSARTPKDVGCPPPPGLSMVQPGQIAGYSNVRANTHRLLLTPFWAEGKGLSFFVAALLRVERGSTTRGRRESHNDTDHPYPSLHQMKQSFTWSYVALWTWAVRGTDRPPFLLRYLPVVTIEK